MFTHSFSRHRPHPYPAWTGLSHSRTQGSTSERDGEKKGECERKKETRSGIGWKERDQRKCEAGKDEVIE